MCKIAFVQVVSEDLKANTITIHYGLLSFHIDVAIAYKIRLVLVKFL